MMFVGDSVHQTLSQVKQIIKMHVKLKIILLDRHTCRDVLQISGRLESLIYTV